MIDKGERRHSSPTMFVVTLGVVALFPAAAILTTSPSTARPEPPRSLAAPAVPTPAPAEQVRHGIGGSSSFPPQTVFRLRPGDHWPALQSLRLQNTGQRDAIVRFEVKAPSGITITTPVRPLRLAPRAQGDFPFSIGIDSTTPAGRHPVVVSGVQSNVPTPPTGGTYVVPAFGVQFTVEVTGEAAGTVNIRALDAADGALLRGTLSLAIPGNQGTPIVIDRGVDTTELSRRVAPGRYVASYEVPGLTQVRQEFTVDPGQVANVDIKVQTINFVVAGARATRAGRTVSSVELVADLANQVREVEGPITFQAVVTRDGEPYTTVRLLRLPKLSKGTTEVRQSYVPAGGLGPGEYQFAIQLVTPTFTLTAAQRPTIAVDAGGPGTATVIAAVAATVAAALAVVTVIRRGGRRRRDGRDRRDRRRGAIGWRRPA